ncbi:MAG TPA: hypothetical protein VK465_01975, partial [Fibrobacteria bacterium]|nr:hypothetical protein [Fibrobacteria bacterium]
MNLFVSAGEVSGDRILAAVLAALRERVPDLKVRGLGGEASARQGLQPLLPLRRTAVSGLGDVLARAGFLARMRRVAFECLESREAGRPDLALLVDYPGLNLRLAARARALGVPVYYIAPPQAWLYKDAAGKAARARRFLAGCVVHALFPFERDTFFAGAERVVRGHFLEAAAESEGGGLRKPAGYGEGGLLLLCPGSREGALRRNLPAWLRALAGAGLLPGGPAAGGAGDAAVLV